ncbi:Carboxylic ester hydrolase [Pleurostoma richardsiae]|uniref:Carboxylic ester hydrolase n=1 Tax=Pleurostoma richardsiae TaxID=41990 RepID=A0AA38R9W7_9PEZI|nr:Carboxylic ester hydrolase [Pleurostoma richardsiae]
MSFIRSMLPVWLAGLTCAESVLGDHATGRGRDCSVAALNDILPRNARIHSVDAVPQNGSYGEGPSDIAYPSIPTGLPELCAIVVNVTSSPSSSFRFALFLPATWNSRFLEVGNGGFAGGINWMDIGVGARYGFATASTDTGHNSTSVDGSWALNEPEKVTDWGWRAIHGTAVAAKSLTEAYYGCQISHSYYSGCSTGGRQGLREAQLYPETFDGLLVGAPAWWTAHLQPWTTYVGALNLPLDNPRHIDPSLFPVIEAEILKQCDGADGIVDGIISSPGQCMFNYNALACGSPGRNTSTCLTAVQLSTLRKIYAPYFADGALACPGLEKGSEPQWDVLFGGSEPNSLGTGYEQYFLFNDPDWSWQQYNDSVISIADKLDPGNATAYAFDMSALRDRGGKVIMYHGMADGYIPTGTSEYFYEQVASATGGLAQLREWFRFFFVPGMGHCQGTAVDAPWYFAGSYQGPSLSSSLYSVPGYHDPRHDALLALMDWVENGNVVESIVATIWKDMSDPLSEVARQRPLCPYPERAGWDQQGDPDQETSWACR